MNSQIRIEFLSNAISGKDGRKALSRQQCEILAVLALRRRRIVSRDEIVGIVWPDKDEDTAAIGLKVGVHRLRRLAGDAAVIRSAPAGYALGGAVATDLDELEALAAEVRGTLFPSAEKVATLRAAFARLTDDSVDPALLPEGIAERFRTLAATIGERLGAYALRSEAPGEALALAEHLIDLDACDESAWEIVIRAHVALHDRGQAIRAYRRYAQTLQNELGLEPSAHIVRLLDDRSARSAAIA